MLESGVLCYNFYLLIIGAKASFYLLSDNVTVNMF